MEELQGNLVLTTEMMMVNFLLPKEFLRACLLEGGRPQVVEATFLAVVEKKPAFTYNFTTPGSRDKVVGALVNGDLSKPRRRQQRGRGKTKDLIGRIIAQHVRFKTLYIS